MHILHINVGKSRTVTTDGKSYETAIDKQPVSGPCAVTMTGLVGDERVEARKLGEAHHAVYAYPHEHYAYWSGRLCRQDLVPGQFGENFTVAGLPETTARIGDIVGCGSAVLQVAHPRIPCRKLDGRMGIRFARDFLESRRVGYYLRVLEPGSVCAGDPIVLMDRDASSPTVDEFVRIAQFDYWNADDLSHLLRARDLVPGWRETLRDKLERARNADGWFGMREMTIRDRHRLPDGGVTISLVCTQRRPLPPFRSGQQITIAWRPPGEQARTLRQAFFPLHPTQAPSEYTVLLCPTAAHESLSHALRVAAKVGDRVRVEAARGGTQ